MRGAPSIPVEHLTLIRQRKKQTREDTSYKILQSRLQLLILNTEIGGAKCLRPRRRTKNGESGFHRRGRGTERYIENCTRISWICSGNKLRYCRALLSYRPKDLGHSSLSNPWLLLPIPAPIKQMAAQYEPLPLPPHVRGKQGIP